MNWKKFARDLTNFCNENKIPLIKIEGNSIFFKDRINFKQDTLWKDWLFDNYHVRELISTAIIVKGELRAIRHVYLRGKK